MAGSTAQLYADPYYPSFAAAARALLAQGINAPRPDDDVGGIIQQMQAAVEMLGEGAAHPAVLLANAACRRRSDRFDADDPRDLPAMSEQALREFRAVAQNLWSSLTERLTVRIATRGWRRSRTR